MKTLRLSLLVVPVALAACSRTVLVGESCTHAAECGGGLVCFNMRCSMGNTGYMPTGKVCVTSQCRDNMDCQGNLTCSGGRCVCAADPDCGLGRKCSSGACVQCTADTDCTLIPDQVCVTGVCRPKCVDSFDCADFFSCNAGKCEFKGCVNDRECAIATRDSRAKCDTVAKTCFVACSADVECGGTTMGQWGGQVCSKGRCENVGCESDGDCQLFLPTGMFGTCQAPPAP